jgi:ABC-type transport system involved in multi-copper enzyme maturation permease subunit
MKAVTALGRLYLLGCLRRQAHLATLFLGVILFMLPAYVNAFSMGSGAIERVSKDFGLTLITYFTVAMALLLGSTSLPADLETRSLYPVLARPVSRGAFLVAHFLAIGAMLAGSAVFLCLCLMLSTGLMIRQFDPTLLIALYGAVLQSAVIAAFCLFASVRLRPAAAGVLGGLLFLVGNLSADFVRLMLPSGPSLLASIVKASVPELSAFALKEPVIHQVAVPFSYLSGMTVYGLGWIGLLLALARVSFEEVDL